MYFYLIDPDKITGPAEAISHRNCPPDSVQLSNTCLRDGGSPLRWMPGAEIYRRRAALGMDDPTCPACAWGDGEHAEACPHLLASLGEDGDALLQQLTTADCPGVDIFPTDDDDAETDDEAGTPYAWAEDLHGGAPGESPAL